MGAQRSRRRLHVVILTAKHHDGFCLWPTRTTTHTWRQPVARRRATSFANSSTPVARKASAGPLPVSVGSQQPALRRLAALQRSYCDQLTELLTRYGPLAEVWFDGANGEGPNGKKQIYDWPRVWTLVRRLQPEAVMFSDAGPDVRWCGNEKGVAGDPNWSTVDPPIVRIRVRRATASSRRCSTATGRARVAPRRGRYFHQSGLVLSPSRRRNACAASISSSTST